MKFVLFAILCIAAVATVKAQTGNYLILAHEEALAMLEDYEIEVEFYRDVLTAEAWDMGYYFSSYMGVAYELTESDEHGDGLRLCAEIAANSCEANIHQYEDQLRDLERDARQLQLSVFKILGETNIKQEGASMLYYDHSLYMDEMWDLLIEHDNRLFDAWIDLYFQWFDVNWALDDCAMAVIFPPEK